MASRSLFRHIPAKPVVGRAAPGRRAPLRNSGAIFLYSTAVPTTVRSPRLPKI